MTSKKVTKKILGNFLKKIGWAIMCDYIIDSNGKKTRWKVWDDRIVSYDNDAICEFYFCSLDIKYIHGKGLGSKFISLGVKGRASVFINFFSTPK